MFFVYKGRCLLCPLEHGGRGLILFFPIDQSVHFFFKFSGKCILAGRRVGETVTAGIDHSAGSLSYGFIGEDDRPDQRNHSFSLSFCQLGKLCAELQRRGCDIGRTTYAKYEAGELNIRASVIIELRKFYKCSFDDFFEGLDNQEE